MAPTQSVRNPTKHKLVWWALAKAEPACSAQERVALPGKYSNRSTAALMLVVRGKRGWCSEGCEDAHGGALPGMHLREPWCSFSSSQCNAQRWASSCDVAV